MNPSYKCPDCDEWIEVLPSTAAVFECPWCKASLRYQHDFTGGIFSNRDHVERMIEHGMKFKHP